MANMRTPAFLLMIVLKIQTAIAGQLFEGLLGCMHVYACSYAGLAIIIAI